MAAAVKNNVAVAEEILSQLGGRRFQVMTGAKGFSAVENGLSFKLPSNFANEGINYVVIKLNSLDLYDVEYGKIRGMKYTVLAQDNGVYADMLRNLFEKRTGLNLSL